MVDKIGDSGDSFGMSSASNAKLYKNEYKRAASDFEDALNADKKSQDMFQKDEFRKSMEEFAQVLKDSATALHNDKLLNRANQIEQDLAAYEKDGSRDSLSQLQKDLDNAKKLQ
jgi:hypothetical protein